MNTEQVKCRICGGSGYNYLDRPCRVCNPNLARQGDAELAAKDAEIERLNKRIADLEHDAKLPRFQEVQGAFRESKLAERLERLAKVSGEWRRSADAAMDCQDKALSERDTLMGQLKAQNALLMEACNVLNGTISALDNCERHAGLLGGERGHRANARTFLSRPEVSALLDGKEFVWVPTVQCNGAMARGNGGRVTDNFNEALWFDTEAECDQWCSKANGTAKAAYVSVKHPQDGKEKA